jgi:hypothetical protein
LSYHIAFRISDFLLSKSFLLINPCLKRLFNSLSLSDGGETALLAGDGELGVGMLGAWVEEIFEA